jgi:hypothetical protein
MYSLIVAVVALAAFAYSLRYQGIFSCQASGYGADRYLAYCQATSYSDYDHGAFWFELEPEAVNAARNAQVLFLGNSRMQFGLSTEATATWLSSLAASYYLLGFSYNGNEAFEAPLLQKLRPKATAYVINLDLFFEPSASPYARAVMRDGSAKTRHEQKRHWQQLHKPTCAQLPVLCGDGLAFFRSRATGSWVWTGSLHQTAPVSYDERVDPAVFRAYTTAGREFLASLPIGSECVILTMVPTVDTGIATTNTSAGTANAVAAALGLPLVAPELRDLTTFDKSHLDAESAQRWSDAFFAAAALRLRSCLGDPARTFAAGDLSPVGRAGL